MLDLALACPGASGGCGEGDTWIVFTSYNIHMNICTACLDEKTFACHLGSQHIVAKLSAMARFPLGLSTATRSRFHKLPHVRRRQKMPPASGGFPLRPSERRRFELMAGQPPFESPNPMQIFVRILQGLRKARSRTLPAAAAKFEARAFGNEAKLPFCRFFGRVHLFLVVILEGNQKEAAWSEGFPSVCFKCLRLVFREQKETNHFGGRGS